MLAVGILGLTSTHVSVLSMQFSTESMWLQFGAAGPGVVNGLTYLAGLTRSLQIYIEYEVYFRTLADHARTDVYRFSERINVFTAQSVSASVPHMYVCIYSVRTTTAQLLQALGQSKQAKLTQTGHGLVLGRRRGFRPLFCSDPRCLSILNPPCSLFLLRLSLLLVDR